jgi:hypothetical protein
MSEGFVRNKDNWDYGRRWMVEWLTLRENHDRWWQWWYQAIRIQKGWSKDQE